MDAMNRRVKLALAVFCFFAVSAILVAPGSRGQALALCSAIWSNRNASDESSDLARVLDKLKNEDLVRVRREGTFLWYSANTEALQELLGFLYAECCTRNKAVEPQKIVCCK